MSGVTEVRLYRNTVDEVPAEYTNVTAAVLNSSLKDHATGIKRYLDGITTVNGLDPGTTYYFWVELIDARGNTAGPQPVGTHTTDPPTVWEFFVSASTHHDLGPTLERIQSIPNTLTVDRLIMAEGWGVHIFDNKNRSFEENAVNYGDYRMIMTDDAVGDKLWTITDPTGSLAQDFRILWQRPQSTPGIQIRRNGVIVYEESTNRGTAWDPKTYWVTYSIN